MLSNHPSWILPSIQQMKNSLSLALAAFLHCTLEEVMAAEPLTPPQSRSAPF